MTAVKTHYGLTNAYNIPSTRDFLCGCEFEIESIKNFDGIHPTDFSVVEDHSLRNNGREFKTRPNSYDQTIALFEKLHKTIKLGKDAFSDRTSIHVHINVRELSLVELRQLVLTYALLEPLFFEYVGEVRKNSIFCVPLNYTYLPSLYKNSIVNLREKWHKYTAFNIMPCNDFGTVEFRHLYGTGKQEVFTTWLTAIKDLYTFIANTPDFNLLKTIEDEKQDVYQLAMSIIPSLAKLHSPRKIKELLEDTLLDVKLAGGGLK